MDQEQVEIEALPPFEERFPNTRKLNVGDKTIYLVGTAHISQQSVEEVEALIREVRPQTVCVELCSTRFKAMREQQSWQNLDIFQVIKQGKTLFLVSSLALSSFQRKMGEKFGVRPGEEQIKAIQMAEEVDAELVLADRDVQATLKRTWAAIPWYKKMPVLANLFESVWKDMDLTEEELEELKSEDQLSKVMNDFATKLPDIKRPLIEERDLFLATKIHSCNGQNVVAVVGAGHVPGITENIDKPVDLEPLEVIPPPSNVGKVLKWIIPILVFSAFYFGFQKHQGQSFEDMLWAWILPNSILSALGAIIAGGKPLSILTAFVASPITSLNPTLGAGMVVGLVEAWLRKPTVANMMNLPLDATTLKGWYKNPVTRTLLVAALSTIGSSLGAVIGLSWLVALWAS